MKLEAKIKVKKRNIKTIRRREKLLKVAYISILLIGISTGTLGFISYFKPEIIVSFFEKINKDTITREEVLSKFYSIPEPTFFISRNQKIMGTIFERYKELVKYEDIPPYVIKAFIAAEDEAFLSHKGINPKAIIRAAINNIREGRIVQGGSTITQQLAKNLFLSHQRTFDRKLKEIGYAIKIERAMTKEEIISLYLSSIYFGNGAWGIKAAARNYFKKDLKDLTLAEAALLAALPRSPVYYSPIRYPDLARKRQTWVLGRMKELGFITESEYEKAKNEKIKVWSWDGGFTKYFWSLEQVRREFLNLIGDEEEIKRGYKVFTTLDEDCYEYAETALRWGIERVEILNGKPPLTSTEKIKMSPRLKSLIFPSGEEREFEEKDRLFLAEVIQISSTGIKATIYDIQKENQGNNDRKDNNNPRTGFISPEFAEVLKAGQKIIVRKCPDENFFCPIPEKVELEGAIIAISPKNGDILCLVGGYDFTKTHFIRATQAKRQVGSAIKPIVYTAAIESGLFTPATQVEDTPVIFEWKGEGANESEVQEWAPKNFEGFVGHITLQEALAKSINAATVRVANRIGIQTIIDMMKRLGIDVSGANYDLTIALGSISLSPLEIARAYTPFANGGKLVKTKIINKVEKAGNIIFEEENQEQKVLSDQTAFIMAWMMRNVVLHGTGWRAKVLKVPVAGKTGTSNKGRDTWFIGFTPEIVVAVWVGKDDFIPIGSRASAGPTVALPIFVEFMKKYQQKLKGEDFKVPDGVVFAKIDPKSGEVSNSNYYIMALPQSFFQDSTTKEEEQKPKSETENEEKNNKEENKQIHDFEIF
ncbi:MAG: penicillin-binding protein 1A [Candidatus Calescibacterium sp.]